ncbi:MAG: hypothetical protein ChlgKO_11050 [Chlamydiales bacterium]
MPLEGVPGKPAVAPEVLTAVGEERSYEDRAQDIYDAIVNVLTEPKKTFNHCVSVYHANKVRVGAILGVGVVAGIFLTVMFNSLLYKLGIKTSESEKLNEMKAQLDLIQKLLQKPIALIRT